MRREVVERLRTLYRVSERRMCRALGRSRSTHRYRSCRDPALALRGRLRGLALSRPRYGYRRLWILLRREGWSVNHKRVLRLYREERLAVRTKPHKKLAARLRVLPPLPERTDEHWSIDFLATNWRPASASGSSPRSTTSAADACAWRQPYHVPAAAVTATLEGAISTFDRARWATLDNGTEFTSSHFYAWTHQHGIQLDFHRPGEAGTEHLHRELQRAPMR